MLKTEAPRAAAEPDIAGGGARCVARGARRVLMVPYFLAEGVRKGFERVLRSRKMTGV